jgi:HPt (histidine-containing phosphotransfer) domain-containing protein
MTIKECYEEMGASYDEIMNRLGKEERVKRFLPKILKDPSYDLLCTSLEKKDVKEAFRAAHTLKGVCQNLALTKLAGSTCEIVELLRNREEYGEDLEPALEKVKADYAQMSDCINRLIEQE